jgi:hypothetical protein
MNRLAFLVGGLALLIVKPAEARGGRGGGRSRGGSSGRSRSGGYSYSRRRSSRYRYLTPGDYTESDEYSSSSFSDTDLQRMRRSVPRCVDGVDLDHPKQSSSNCVSSDSVRRAMKIANKLYRK